MPDKKVKILAFAGSTRKDSFNKLLVRQAAKGAEDAGAEVTVIDLKDFPMPIYDGDEEATNGIPQKAKELKQLLQEADGFLIASPEYNGSYTGVLKNAFDWASRKEVKGEVSPFNGKTAVIMSTGTGRLGGLRGLAHLRDVLMDLKTNVLPQMQAVGGAATAFENGKLKDPQTAQTVEGLGATLAKHLQQLKK